MTPTMTETEPIAVPAAFQALDAAFEHLPLTQIVRSKTNPRTHFDPLRIANLARSLAEKGCIEPIVVRPLKKAGTYEIVAGECRYRAALEAKLTHLPAVIRGYTDEQVLEVQLIENVLRQDLTPLEQARGYRALINANPTKHSAESIATRVGMSPAWVWDRMKLLDLVPEAQALLEAERMSVGHAILIARQKPADQQRIMDPGPINRFGDSRDGLWQHDGGRLELDDDADERRANADKYHGLKPVSVRELETWIHDHIRFDVAHMAKAAPLQFAETAAKVEQAAAQPGRGKRVIAITHEYRVADDARDAEERTFGSESWKRADGQLKSKTCEHAVLGLVVAGRGQGETLEVCIAREQCRVHFGDVIRAKEKAAQLRASGKTTQAAKVEKRQVDTWQEENRKREEAQKRWNALKPHAIRAAVAKTKATPITAKVLEAVVSELLDYGGTLKQLEGLLGGKITAKTFTRALAIVQILHADNTRESFQPIAKRYGIELATLERAVAHTSGVDAKTAGGKKGRA